MLEAQLMHLRILKQRPDLPSETTSWIEHLMARTLEADQQSARVLAITSTKADEWEAVLAAAMAAWRELIRPKLSERFRFSISELIGLLAVMFPPKVRERIFVPCAEELKETYILDQKATAGVGRKAWIGFWCIMNLLHLTVRSVSATFFPKGFPGFKFLALASAAVTWIRSRME
jgi:hypothetical protein